MANSIRIVEQWVSDLTRFDKRAFQAIEGIVVHRIEVSQEDSSFTDTPRDIIRFFEHHSIGMTATGGKMPYPVLVGSNGEVTQTLPLEAISPHARSYNATMIGLACIGDFRARAPDSLQRQSCVAVCASLLQSFGLSGDLVFAHDALSGGSADPNKLCPGPAFQFEALKHDVRTAMRLGGRHYPFVWRLGETPMRLEEQPLSFDADMHS